MKARAVGWTLGAVLVVVSTVFLGFVGFVASVAMVLLIAFVPGCGALLAAGVGCSSCSGRLGTDWGVVALIVGLVALFVFGIVDNVTHGRQWYAMPDPQPTGTGY